MLFGLFKTKKDRQIESLQEKLALTELMYHNQSKVLSPVEFDKVEIKPFKACYTCTSTNADKRIAKENIARNFARYIYDNGNVVEKITPLGISYEMTVYIGFPKENNV